MKSYGLLNETIDREDESNEIISAISCANSNEVYYVYSETAVGKSSLSKKVIEKYTGNKHAVIRVKTNPENQSTQFKEWLFIEKIFDKIKEHFDLDQRYSFETYISSMKDSSMRKRSYEVFLDKISNCKKLIEAIILILTYPIKALFKLNEFNVQNTLEDNSYESHMIMVRYILYILNNTSVLLIIDNVQNFDAISWTHFISWLNTNTNKTNYFILEYTLSETNNFEKMFRQMEEIRDTETSVKYIRLDRLKEEYVVDIIDKNFPDKPQDINFNIELLDFYKHDKTGNIRKLIDFTINYNPNEERVVSPTLENLLSLSKISKYIFSVVLNCNGEIQYSELLLLLNANLVSTIQSQKAFDELKNKHIVDIQDEIIVISHPTLIDEWNKNIDLFTEYQKTACISMDKYFCSVLFESDEDYKKSRAWLLLIQIYSKNSPEKINNLLQIFNSGTIEQITPSRTWYYLSCLIENIRDNLEYYKETFFTIISICFSLELYNEGFNCISLMNNQPFFNDSTKNRLLLYKSMFLSALDKHKENIDLYKDTIHSIEKNSREYFNLNLIVLCSYRSLNQYNECLKIHKELLKCSKNMPDYEYGIFLRLTNVYLSDNKALQFAKRSVKQFHSLGDNIQEAKSLITYSKLLAGLGKYDRGIKCLNKANSLLGNKYFGRHMIYTNQAAYMLMSGNHNENVWMLLENAECSAVVPYDKLAIIVNKLVWCYENNTLRTVKTLIKKAETIMPNEPDEHVHVLIYYNLYLLFKQNGNENMSKKYYDLAYLKREKCKFVNARLSNIKNKEMRFRLKYPWHVCFLSYWTYDLDSQLFG